MSKQSDLVGVSQGSAGDPLYVDSTNNKVGIGTSSPDTALNIGFSGADQSNALRIEGSNGSSERYALDIEADGEYAKTNFKIGVGGGAPTTRMTIDSSGNVGIGTSPATGVNLHLHEAGSGQMLMAFTNDTTGSGSNDGLHVGIDSSENSFVYNKQNTTLYFGTNNTERMRIDASGRVTMPYQPAFRVTGNSTTNFVAIYDELIFPTEDFDNGNHFNLTSGRFTAPVSGYYFFSAHLVATNATIGTTGELYLIKNDNTSFRYFLDRQHKSGGTSSNSYSLGGSVVIYLSANDFVGVAAHSLSTSVVIETSSNFSGYLLG